MHNFVYGNNFTAHKQFYIKDSVKDTIKNGRCRNNSPKNTTKKKGKNCNTLHEINAPVNIKIALIKFANTIIITITEWRRRRPISTAEQSQRGVIKFSRFSFRFFFFTFILDSCYLPFLLISIFFVVAGCWLLLLYQRVTKYIMMSSIRWFTNKSMVITFLSKNGTSFT